MQGAIAQIVALTIHGNAFLQHFQNSQGLDFQARNSTFKFCEWVRFTDLVSGASNFEERAYTADVHEWFEGLKKDGVCGVKMNYGASAASRVPDRMLVGFVGGGGKWSIETRRSSSSDFWKSRWQLGNRDRKDKRIWRVSYVRFLSRRPSTQAQPEDLEQLRSELEQCLERITQFSRSQNLEWFTRAFESGIVKLESPDPLADIYHADIAPPGFLSLVASQLLGSAQAAWVFGGMGSWNDQGFEGQTQARYEQLSEELYQLLNRVIVAAANSSTPG